MKKLSICFLALFASLLLSVPVALAADGVQELNVKSSETAIKLMQSDKTTPATETNGVYQNVSVFNVTSKVQAEDGKLYLIVIRSGEENQLPTESNLFYMDLLEAKNGSVVSDAYPKDLEAGSYHIELTDYSDNGRLKEIASFTVSAGGGTNTGNLLIGDVNDDKEVNSLDVLALINRIVNAEPMEGDKFTVANTNGDDDINSLDVLRLISHLVDGTPLGK